MADSDLKKGTFKCFNDQKGFGFITPDDGSEDRFVHQSAIKSGGFRSLGEGEEVEYSVEYGHDGRAKAANVTGLDGADVQGCVEAGAMEVVVDIAAAVKDMVAVAAVAVEAATTAVKITLITFSGF
ncbi:hypothetical protein ACS0TY_022304 [Phlomoides rotata]